MNKKQLLGSRTAKGGFANEKAVCKKFDNWQNDIDAKLWLEIMGYNISEIAMLKAIQIPTRISKKDYKKYNLSPTEYFETTKFKKADAQVQLTIKIGKLFRTENISIKKANKNSNFNQIDKRPVSTYKKIWDFNNTIEKWLKLFTGALHPSNASINLINENHKNKNRLFLNEIPKKDLNQIIDFFTEKKVKVISDILRGRGFFLLNGCL